jgi:DinB family protein
MQYAALIDDFAAGTQLLRGAVKGMTREQVIARPVAGKWSTLEVVCHLSDFEIVYADRIKRVIAEERPTLPDGDEQLFAARLAYHSRELDEELQVFGAIRASTTRILRTLADADFGRIGIHAAAGPLTLQQFVERGVNHVKHHVKFIAEKRKALGI